MSLSFARNWSRAHRSNAKMAQILAYILLACVAAAPSFGEANPYAAAARAWRHTHNYVQVRPGAFMFYWLWYADGTPEGAPERPLLVWVQGGPGLAASGVGNFGEIGPLTLDLKPRNHTWVRGRNVLLIDHPVGTGFSYVTDPALLARTDREAATDLARTIKIFLKQNKEFVDTPTYLFGQSYGGKLLPRLAYYLHTAVKNNGLRMNLRGAGVGGGWLLPRASVLSQPACLYSMGAIDKSDYIRMRNTTRRIARLIDKGNYALATALHDSLFDRMTAETQYFNNLNRDTVYKALDDFTAVMNVFVKPTLHRVSMAREWSYSSTEVYDSLHDNFLVPSTKFLELLLNRTSLNIAVYNGNLDAATPLVGAVSWVSGLRWAGAGALARAPRRTVPGGRRGYYRAAGRLSFWGVYGAGHWVPEDNPEAMEHIINFVIDGRLPE